MADREGNVLRPPGTGIKTEVVPVEIVASYDRLIQKGVTLATGVGVLRAGQALKKGTGGDAKKYVPAAAADSASVVGFLRDAVDTATESHEANVVFAGVLNARTLSYSDYVPDARTVTDAVFNSTTTVTSATAAFTPEDVGRTVVGAGVPAGATIATVGSATSITLSAATTTTGSGKTITVGAGSGLKTATLDTLATALGGKYLSVQDYFKF